MALACFSASFSAFSRSRFSLSHLPPSHSRQCLCSTPFDFVAKAVLGSTRWQWGQYTCASSAVRMPVLRNSVSFACHFSLMSFQYLKPKMVLPAPEKSKADSITSSAATSLRYVSRSRLSNR